MGASCRTVSCTTDADVCFDKLQPAGVGSKVCFGQHDQSGRDLQQVQDGQVLAGLRHDAFVGGDDQQGRVDPPDPGQHVLDKVPVPGHIHDADLLAVGQGEPSKAKVDGHLAGLFLLEAVRMNPRQRSDESGLSMVDVACGSNDSHDLQRSTRRPRRG